jgi:hypothetical protein
MLLVGSARGSPWPLLTTWRVPTAPNCSRTHAPHLERADRSASSEPSNPTLTIRDKDSSAAGSSFLILIRVGQLAP